MKGLRYAFCLVLIFAWGSQAERSDLADPVDAIEWLNAKEALTAPSAEFDTVIKWLDDRQQVQSPSGIPTSPSSAARKLLTRHLNAIENELPGALPTLSRYGQTRLISVLAQGEQRETLYFLRDLLDDPSSSIRSAALEAIIERHSTTPYSIKQWMDEGWTMQSAEALKLPGRLSQFEMLNVLLGVHAQFKGDAAKQASGFWSIAQLVNDYPEESKVLFNDIKNSSENAVLAKAITQSSATQAEAFLIDICKKESTPPEVLSLAISGLPYFTSPTLKKLLLDSLFFSPSKDVTMATSELMGRSGDPLLAIPLAFRGLALSEVYKEKFGKSIKALGKPASDLLCQRLLEPNYIIVRSSLEALRRMGETASDSMYEAIMWPNLDFDIRSALQFLIERTGKRAPTEEQQVFFRLLTGTEYATEYMMRPWLSLLQEWTDYPVAQIQIAAHETLGFFRDPISTDLLIDALKGPDITLANVAAKGLESRIFSLSHRIAAEMKKASISEAKIMADALALIEFVPHRTKERALFEATRERWGRLNRLPAPAADGILEAFIKAAEPQSIASLAWAVHHLDPDTPSTRSGSYPGLPQILPWNTRAEKINTVTTLQNVPILQRQRIIALAACTSEPALIEPALEYVLTTDSFPFELLIRLHESQREPLVQFAYTALLERDYTNLAPLEKMMTQRSRKTAQVMAERLNLEGYSPETTEGALLFHDLMGNWPQLLAIGESGQDIVRENVKTLSGREAIDRYIGLAGVSGVHPVPFLAQKTAERPDELFYSLLAFYKNQSGINFKPILVEWLKKSSDGASFILASLLAGLEYSLEDPVEEAIFGYALNQPILAARNEQAGRQFLLDELMQENPDRLSRASAWALKHRTYAVGREHITRSIKTQEEIQAILDDENDLIVLTLLNYLPALHRSSTNDLGIVETLLPLLDSERVIPTQQGAVPLSFKAAEALIQIGEDAAKPLLEVWEKDPETASGATYLALMGISSPTLLNAQKTMLRYRKGLDDRGLIATIKSIAKLKDPSTAPILYEIALEEHFGVRVAAINALVGIGEPVIPLVQKTLEYGNPSEEQRVAAKILSQIGGEQAEQEFLDILKRKQPHIRQQAIDHLIKSRNPEALTLFVGLLDADGTSPSIAGSQALIRWGKEAIPPIIDSLYKGTERSKKLKIFTLTQMTGMRFGDDPGEWKRWYQAQTARPRG